VLYASGASASSASGSWVICVWLWPS